MQRMPKLSGKVAIITGASSGIGSAIAKHFSKLGCILSLVGRNEDNLNDVVNSCAQLASDNQPKAYTTVGDLTDENITRSVIENTVQTFGKIDILVNNAGILEVGTIENTSLEQYDRVLNVNVRVAYHLTMLAVPYLVSTKGCVVNISSVNGIRSFPGVLAYNVSKAALDQFTRCVALELAPKQVRVNSVNPGVIVTNLQKRGGMSEEVYNEFLERSKTTHALGRPGVVEEVAAAVAFLASDEASFITGASLPVDGGRHAMCPR